MALIKLNTRSLSDDSVTTPKIADTVNLGRRNLIHNGDFQVWQRGTGDFTLNNSNAYTVDRWHGGTNGSEDVIYSRSTYEVQRYALRVRRTGTSSGRMYATQMIETATLDMMRGQTITLSYRARKGSDFNTTFVSRIGTQTNETPRDDSKLEFNDYTASLTTDWQTFSHSLTLTSTSNSGSGLLVEFIAESGAGGTSNFWYEITDVQLEIGSVATPFERLPYYIVEKDCQRYYYQYNGTNNGFIMCGGYVDSSYVHIIHVGEQFPAVMRAIPAITIYSGSGDGYVDGYGRGQTGAGNVGAESGGVSTQTLHNLNFRAGGGSENGSTGALYRGGYKASAEL